MEHLANPGATEVGKDVTFTALVSLDTNVHLPAATLASVVPSNADFVWASPGCAHAAGTVTCNLVPVAGVGIFQNYQMKVEIVLRPNAPGALTNTFTVSSPQPGLDLNTSNNADAMSVEVTQGAAGVPVPRYRLYSPTVGEHLFTTDLNEYMTLGEGGGWIQEGTSGNLLDNPGQFNGVTAIPYYRLVRQSNSWHHWTADPNEYYTIRMFAAASGWIAEGVDGYVLPTTTAGATQLYRIFYPPNKAHHWTADANEYSVLTAQYGWVGEGAPLFVVQ